MPKSPTAVETASRAGHPPPAGEFAERPRGPGDALAAALIGFVVVTVDVSAVNVALPAMGEQLDGGMAGLQWVVDSYTLFFAALMLSAGALSDRVGARRAYGWGLVVFTLASLACGSAPTLGVLIGARVVQGAAAAVLMPTSLALIRQSFGDAGRRARAVGVWTAGGAFALAAGPALGGLLTTVWEWRAVFFLNVPVGVVGLALLSRVGRSPRRAAAFDLPGQLTAVLASAALTYAVIEGGHGGFGRPGVLAAVALAVAAGAGFVVVEARHRDPMVPLELLRRRSVLASVTTGFAANAAFYGAVFVFGLFFQRARGQSALSAGLMFVPMALSTAALNLFSARLTARFGRRTLIVLGQLVLGAALLLMACAGTRTPVWLVLLMMVPVGVAGATVVPALTSLLLDAVEPARAGTAAAVFNTGRQLGGAMGVAVFGLFLAGPVEEFVPGMRVCMAIGAGAAVVTGAAAGLLLRPRG
ncbi:MFS transporter [Streptomyces sp. NRRL S-1868]|uniref:MFS transporter n=1 Tax=Streptomyces sp. NRRL S-1868 TaxID=1463892 RepID=UPI00099B3EE7|nr:MFS transporter [Streptomyces sp. NRRL S-1868]